jgi:hypothetical protein
VLRGIIVLLEVIPQLQRRPVIHSAPLLWRSGVDALLAVTGELHVWGFILKQPHRK